jgi:glycosyltransferase involved in cell wall biosynthesis
VLVPLDGAAEHAGRALLQLLNDPQLVRTMRERGPMQARKFTWDDVADRTLAAWRRMAAKPASGVARASAVTEHVLDGVSR